MKPNYGNLLTRYVLAGATEEQHNAAIRMLAWMCKAETRQEFLLYMDGLDAIEVFSVRFIKILVRTHPADTLMKKAVELKVLRRRV